MHRHAHLACVVATLVFALACGSPDDAADPWDAVAEEMARDAGSAQPSIGFDFDGSTCTERRPVFATGEALSGPAAVERVAERVDEALASLVAGPPERECPGAERHVVELRFPAGDIYLDPGDGLADPVTGARARPAIFLRDARFAQLGGARRLELVGEGMNATTIIVPLDTVAVRGHDARYVTFRDLHFTQDTGANRFKVTQGVVVASNVSNPIISDAYPAGRRYHYIDLRLDDGFPTPRDIDSDRGGCRKHDDCGIGKWLRRYYVNDAGTPKLDVSPANTQQPWIWSSGPVQDKARRYRIYLDGPHPYAIGDRVAVKSKHGSSNAYVFNGGAKISFVGVRWSQEARGTFRNVDFVRVEGCRVEPVDNPGGPRPMLSTSAGGPQFGNTALWDTDAGETAAGHAAIDNVFVGTGDDALAFFNVDLGPSGQHTRILGNTVIDSFARGILLFDVDGYVGDTYPADRGLDPWRVYRLGDDNRLVRCPIAMECHHHSAAAAGAPNCIAKGPR